MYFIFLTKYMFLFFRLLISIFGFVISSSSLFPASENANVKNVENINELGNKFFEYLDQLKKEKKYSDIIDICVPILNAGNIEYYDEIDILIILGDAYFLNGENKKCINIYRTLLNKYGDFDGIEDVLHNLCFAIYKIMPKSYKVDLEYCKKMINYGNYSLSKIKKIEYLSHIRSMISEAEKLIELKEFNDIRFFYKNRLYDSALFCCNKFLDAHFIGENQKLAVFYKVKILYKLLVKHITFFKKINKNVEPTILEEMYLKIIKYYEEMNNVYRTIPIDFSKKAEILIQKTQIMMSNINKN